MIVRPTELRRVLLTQEARVFVPQCDAALMRQVQLLVPDGSIRIGESVPPNETGPNRVYKLAPAPTNTRIILHLGPEQFLTGATTEGAQPISVIIEYKPLPVGYTTERHFPAPLKMPTKESPTRELVPGAVTRAIEKAHRQ